MLSFYQHPIQKYNQTKLFFQRSYVPFHLNTITGEISITVSFLIFAEAKTPRPRLWELWISRIGKIM